MSTAERAIERSNGEVSITEKTTGRKSKFTLSFTPEDARAIESVAFVLGFDSPEDFCKQAVLKEVNAQLGSVRRQGKAKP